MVDSLYKLRVFGVEELAGAASRDEFVCGPVDIRDGNIVYRKPADEAILLSNRRKAVGIRAVKYHDYRRADCCCDVCRAGIV